MKPLHTFLQNLSTLLNKVPESILITDERHRIVFVNKSFSAFSGFEYELLIGKSASFIFDKEGVAKINSQLRNSFIEELSLPFNFSGNRKRTLNTLCFDLMISDDFTGRIIIVEPSKEGIFQQEPDQLHDSILRVMNSRKDAVWYMTDVPTGKNFYTSESVKEVIGWEASHFNLGGYGFFFSIMHPDDHADYRDRHLEWILLNNKLGPIFEHVPFSKTVRLKGMNGKYKFFHVEANVLDHTTKGKVKTEFGSFQKLNRDAGEERLQGMPVNHIRMIDGKVFVEVDYLKDLKRQHTQSKSIDAFKVLTTREKEVMQLIAETLSSKAISDKLDLSIHTVNLHRKQIMKKLRAKNLAELIKIYYQSR